jgi:CBS domain-containing protein
MNTTLPTIRENRLILDLERAHELMTPNPISIPATATVKEAVAVLVDKRISAAAVVDVVGRPVGVLSQSDILIHHRNKAESTPPMPEYYQKTDLTAGGKSLLTTFKFENVDRTLVHQVMTPTVIAVRPNESAARVVGEMVAFKIHRLFVVDEAGVLVGVISAFDVLRKLRVDVEVASNHDPLARVS